MVLHKNFNPRKYLLNTKVQKILFLPVKIIKLLAEKREAVAHSAWFLTCNYKAQVAL